MAIGLALTAMMGAGTIMTGSANADPQQLAAFAGVGSDTTEGVVNAFAGYNNGIFYTPLHSATSASPAVRGDIQIISFDALKPGFVADNCITTKLNGPSFYRPNGSGAGRKALNAAAGLGGGWTGSGGCGTLQDLSGQVDFARSSGISTPAGTDEVFIPFARDAVSFASYKPGVGAAVTTLSRADLQAIYAGATRLVVGGVTIIPCGLQTSSGTFGFWNTALGVAATENAATDQCNLAGTGARVQESDGPALKAKGDALNTTGPLAGTNFEVISAFSAAAFIARTNGIASPAPGPGVAIGAITGGVGPNLGSPVVAGTPLTPNATFYNDGTFGRLVYNVLPVSVANGPGNAAMKAIFVGATSQVCNSGTTIQSYGFLTTAQCGDTSTTFQRAWEPGVS